MKKVHHTTHHTPVLLEEVLKYLNPQRGETYLDLTAGYGGHAKAILARTLQTKHSVLVDRDSFAVEHLRRQFDTSDVLIKHSDFLNASYELIKEKKQFDLILADLGISSPHIDNPDRGFSFVQDGPLDMRMDDRQKLTAAVLVNTASEKKLSTILFNYGQEQHARMIAKAIVKNRPFTRTVELADVVCKAIGGGWHKTNPATKTFQALRIAVNDELHLLQEALPLWFQLLAPGGRIAVISFHSLEDRIVKQAFQEVTGDRYDASLGLLTKKPITSTKHEIVTNPRARSAKLRVAVKIKTERNN